jgi:hypothetical protein
MGVAERIIMEVNFPSIAVATIMVVHHHHRLIHRMMMMMAGSWAGMANVITTKKGSHIVPHTRAVEVKDDIGRRRRLGQTHDGGSWLRGSGYS